jgi:hypothetical protein
MRCLCSYHSRAGTIFQCVRATESADIVREISLTDKTVIVTGDYSGLGRVVARSLAGVGAKGRCRTGWS